MHLCVRQSETTVFIHRHSPEGNLSTAAVRLVSTGGRAKCEPPSHGISSGLGKSAVRVNLIRLALAYKKLGLLRIKISSMAQCGQWYHWLMAWAEQNETCGAAKELAQRLIIVPTVFMVFGSWPRLPSFNGKLPQGGAVFRLDRYPDVRVCRTDDQKSSAAIRQTQAAALNARS